MLQDLFGFSCCGRNNCGTGAKSASVTVLRRRPQASLEETPQQPGDAKIVLVEPDFAMLEREISQNIPWQSSVEALPRWGSFSDESDGSDEDGASMLSDKSSLDRCVLALKRSAIKARRLAEQEANGGAGQCVLPSLRSAEHSCALLAAADSNEHVTRHTSHAGHATAHGNVSDGPKISRRTVGPPSLARQSSSQSTEASDGSTEPAGIHKHATGGYISDSDGDLSDYDGVSNRYSSQKVQTVIQGLRERMLVEGVKPPSTHLPVSARSAAKRHKELKFAPSHREEVQSYQAVMRSKFEAMGVPEGGSEVFVDTALPSMAVRDAVTKYHTHCRDMNKYYAMPGEESNLDLRTEDRLKLDHYVKDLRSEGHTHSPSSKRN